MKLDHLSFTEAVERLAGAGRHHPAVRGGRLRPRPPAGRAASGWSRRTGPPPHSTSSSWARAEAEIGRRFLAERGFDQAAAEHFGVGYAPAGLGPPGALPARQGLHRPGADHRRARPESRRGGAIDRFRGRLIWPIRDITGEVIGFGARKLREDDQGPEVPQHPRDPALPEVPGAVRDRPGQEGDRQDRPGGRRRGLHRRDGLPPRRRHHRHRHLRHLLRRRPHQDPAPAADGQRQPREVVFTFDGDEAGQKAALRAFEDDQKFAAETSIAVTPGGMDPCELRLAEGDAAVQRAHRRRAPRCSPSRCARSSRATTSTPTRAGSPRWTPRCPWSPAIKNQALRDRYAIRLVGMARHRSTGRGASMIRRVGRWPVARGGRRRRRPAPPRRRRGAARRRRTAAAARRPQRPAAGPAQPGAPAWSASC